LTGDSLKIADLGNESYSIEMPLSSEKEIPATGISHIQTLDGISEYQLTKNGLRILLAQDTSVPVVGFMVTYHVGSRNEATGYTGATHLLEHLLFKGSEKFNKKNKNTIWELLESKGAKVNATTWFDRTNYYEVLPSEFLSEAIALEADRMRTARITENDKITEMPIVRNEFERGENLPVEALDKQIWATAFQAHPYHHSTIGWRTDIEQVPIERLQQFYNDFYWPNNATVTVAGDFEKKEVLELIKKHFGVHSKSPKPFPLLYTDEPTQEGERRVVVKRSGVNMIAIAHKIPNAHHKDIPALALLAVILSEDKTSRLYKALVDTALSTSAEVYCWQLHDPALFETFVTLSPKTNHLQAEKIVKQEYQKIIESGVSAPELVRAKKAVRTYVASRRDGPYAFLAGINEDLATGDWKRFVTFPKALEKVTSKDIQNAAKKYLVDDQSTVGWFMHTSK
jgi:zinc protease